MRSEVTGCTLGLLLWLLCAPLPRAYAEEPLRLVLRLASAEDRALLLRVRGQLSDVNAELIEAETASLEATLPEQLEVARSLSRALDASAVAWCVGAKGAQPRMLLIALARGDRLLSRELSPTSEGAASSSELETAAVLVRSATLALLAGVQLGVPASDMLASSVEADAKTPRAPVSESDVDRAAGSNTPSASARSAGAAGPDAPTSPASGAAGSGTGAEGLPPRAAEPERASGLSRVDGAAPLLVDQGGEGEGGAPQGLGPGALQARVSVGAQLALDGKSSLGQRGLYARAGMGLGLWSAAVYGAFSLASEIEDPHFALRVARHALGVAVERRVPLSDALWLSAAVHAGALLLRRTSHAESPGAVGYPASLMAAFALGPELGFGWLPGRYGLSVRFGLDWLPNAPRFEASGTGTSHTLWAFEPRIVLGWEAALP